MIRIRNLAPVAAMLLCALLVPFAVGGDATLSSVTVEMLLLTGAASSWNIFSGYTGYISLGHATFYGMGAYCFALAVQNWQLSGGFGLFLLLPLAGLAAGLAALPLGWVALRTRRHAFVVITIAFVFILQLLATNLQEITGGTTGIFLPIPGWGADLSNIPFYFAALALLLLVVIASWLTRRSRFGLVLLAIRDDEDRVRGLGRRAARYKLGAYVLSAALTGMFGGLAIFFAGLITPSTAFDQALDITLVAITLLGGIGSVVGPLIGGLLLVPVQAYLSQQFSADIPGMNLALLGAFLLLTLMLLPRGIVPAISAFRARGRATSRGREREAHPRSGSAPSHLSPGFPAHLAAADIVEALIANPAQSTSVPQAAYIPGVIPQRSPTRQTSQKLRALRLERVASPHPLPPVPGVTIPVGSWRCPNCRRPFLLRENLCYCRRCGITRALT